MSDNSKIEWTDATWNPITGCSVVSAGCKSCYAMKLAGTRLQHLPSRVGLTQETKAGPVWTGEVRFNWQWLDMPLRWTRPRRIFVCAHGDLFHENVPDKWIDYVFEVMRLAPQHTFQVLTKRPKRMASYFGNASYLGSASRGTEITFSSGSLPGRLMRADQNDAAVRIMAAYKACGDVGIVSLPLPNVWLGVSVENQEAADERIPLLLQCPAAVRWISAEPLLGPIDLHGFVSANGQCFNRAGMTPALDWVVAGGESGTGARPMHPDWARSLRDQCAAAGVPFLFKQWGAWAPYELRAGGDLGGELRSGTVQHLHAPGNPEGHFRRGDEYVQRIGKKAAGRLLDDVQHDNYPQGVRQ